MLNLIANEFTEAEEIILPSKEKITIPPLTLAITMKYQNTIRKFGNPKKLTVEQANTMQKTFMNLILEWLNTNLEQKEISMKYLEENFNSKQITALIECFGQVIIGTEKK